LDSGIWATWYDLPDQGRDEFLDWLHGTHLPALVARPGYLWAASYEVLRESPAPPERRYDPETEPDGDIGMGWHFIQLVGAPAPRVFFNPNWDALPEVTSPEAQEMLGRRVGTRHAILMEEGRVDGPEAAERAVATAPGPVIQMGSFRLKTQEADFALANGTARTGWSAWPACPAASPSASWSRSPDGPSIRRSTNSSRSRRATNISRKARWARPQATAT